MIKMIRGALKSPKTPKQLIPSLKKRLAKLTGGSTRLSLILAAAGSLFLFPSTSFAQFIGYTSPQTVAANPLVARTTPVRVNVPNIGQNMHYLNWTTLGTITALDLRLEGSNDGTNWFPISDDSTDLTSAFGSVYATGYFAVVSVNLINITGGGSITASYSGTSGTAGSPLGNYNPSQQVRKVVFSTLVANANQQATVSVPFSSALGYIIIATGLPIGGGLFPAGSSLTVTPIIGNLQIDQALSVSMGTGAVQVFGVTGKPATSVKIDYVSGGASAQTINCWYVFVNPSEPSGISWPTTQPLETFNSESSAVATAVTKSLPVSTSGRIHLFSVSARCSAGTSSLTVKDGVAGTTIWSSGTTEVGTTTFKNQWNPSLSSSFGNGMDIVLGTCGGGNTGTLDVQASRF